MDHTVVTVTLDLSGAYSCLVVFFFQAEDGIRDLVRSRGLGDVYKRQAVTRFIHALPSLYNADPQQIYLMGFSQGAATAYALSLIHI